MIEDSPYPNHMTEPIRFEIAQSLVAHETKKLFASVPPDAQAIMAADVSRWVSHGPDYQLSSVRDFWNGVDGIMMGFKLKNIVPILTAENVSWRKGQVKVADVQFAVDFGEVVKKRQTGAQVAAFFAEHPDLLAQDKAVSDEVFTKQLERESDPIIVLEEEDTSQMVHDGNGRLKRAVIYQRATLPAYIGQRVGETNRNYWVPTGLLMRFVELAKLGQEEAAATALITYFHESESAVYEFSERAIAKDNPFRQKVLELWQNTAKSA